MSREEIFNDFCAKFVATIGTAGSNKGMDLQEALSNFKKDWGPIESFCRTLGHREATSLLREAGKFVRLERNRVFAVVNQENHHVFHLIDNTKKKNRKLRSALKKDQQGNVSAISKRLLRSKPTNTFAKKSASFKNTFENNISLSDTTNSFKRPSVAHFSISRAQTSVNCWYNSQFNVVSTFTDRTKSEFQQQRKVLPSQNSEKNETAMTHLFPVKRPAVAELSLPTKINATPIQSQTSVTTKTSRPSVNEQFSAATINDVTEKVRHIVKLISDGGGSLNLEELKKKYYDANGEDLTGVKLAKILELDKSKKNPFIAFQSYRPALFACILRNSDIVVTLTKACDPLLEQIKTGAVANSHCPVTSETEQSIKTVNVISEKTTDPSTGLSSSSSSDSVSLKKISKKGTTSRSVTLLKSDLFSNKRNYLNRSKPTITDLKNSESTINCLNMSDRDSFFDLKYIMSMLDVNMLYLVSKIRYSNKEAKQIIKKKFNAMKDIV